MCRFILQGLTNLEGCELDVAELTATLSHLKSVIQLGNSTFYEKHFVHSRS
jgi:hypothetical protein